MAATFKLVRPSNMFAMSRVDSTSAVVGSVDATYTAGWLVDGRTGYPVRKTGSSISLAITGAAQDVDVLCVGHHNIAAAATVNITGDITTTITIPTWPPNNIPLNGVRILGGTTSGVDALTVAVTGQTESSCIIGEFVAGLSESLPRTLQRDTRFTHRDYRASRPMDMAFIPPYDKGLYSRVWAGTGLFTAAQKVTAQEIFEEQRSATRPLLIIPDTSVNDAWFVQFTAFEAVPNGQLYRVSLTFEEYPRSRW
jgi:hypothetical protein